MIVETAQGRLAGMLQDGIRVYRGVPYAAAERFAPPGPAQPWSGVRQADRDGAVAPQNPSRLAQIMGPFEAPQSEDCLSLTIWAPAEAAGCPVVVWFHGGAYVSGAGSLPWYSGEAFARNGVILVGVNHRLGPLGYLYLPGVSDGNLGLLDQIAALGWVRDHITAFGGDPGKVTAMGQSAGAAAIVAMLAAPGTAGLFRRMILQSPAIGRAARPRDEALRLGKRYAELVGQDLATAPVPVLLSAAGKLAAAEKRFADYSPVFSPVVDGALILEPVPTVLARGAADGLDLLLGTAREEMAAFFGTDTAIQQADAAALEAVFSAHCGADWRHHLAEYRRRRPGASAAALLGDLVSDRSYRDGVLDLAETHASRGGIAYLYQFDWQPPSGLQAAHTIELPFVFDNLRNWRDAPILRGADPGGLPAVMNRAWCAFAATGDPNHDGLPPWRPYGLTRRTTMRFDTETVPVGDLAGRGWRLR